MTQVRDKTGAQITDCSITTDYNVLDPVTRPAQCMRMGGAGFKFIHWCWDWDNTTVYGEQGIADARRMLDVAGLQLVDTHAVSPNAGPTHSPDESQFELGIRLLEDRIRFTAELGGDAVTIHPPPPEDSTPYADRLKRAEEAWRHVEPLLRKTGVRLALENTGDAECTRLAFEVFFNEFDTDLAGFTFDTGHARVAGNTDWLLQHCLPRLCVTHLHDNDGTADQHLLPFDGMVDWPKVMKAIREAGCEKPINLEVGMKKELYRGLTEEEFLAEAHARSLRLLSLPPQSAE